MITGIIVVLWLIVAMLFCCLVVASEYDDREERGK